VPGQTTAFSLLVPAATLMVVGYTMGEATLRLSNLMAFEARAVGNWGCAPEHYPALLEKILAGKIDVVSGTEMRPLSTIAAAFEEVRAHKTDKRLVLVPGR
jgi:6-hydroxycyclohex-1-ene-1-carbonyl-CoA dehydrogenase